MVLFESPTRLLPDSHVVTDTLRCLPGVNHVIYGLVAKEINSYEGWLLELISIGFNLTNQAQWKVKYVDS